MACGQLRIDAPISDAVSRGAIVAGSVLRVLLVEDDDIDAKLVGLCAATIEGFRLDIERVVSSADARDRLATRHFDLCIVDFWLGCESSIRLLAELDSFRHRTPALVLTSLSTPDIRQMCVMAGAAVFLGKADLSGTSLENAVIRTLNVVEHARALAAQAPARTSDVSRMPGAFELRTLQAMTETVRFSQFETFWADRTKTDGGASRDYSVDVGDFIFGAVGSVSTVLAERGQTVLFQRPDPAVTLSCDPANFFFIVFELLNRASRLSARDSTLRIGLTSNSREIGIGFLGGTRIDATAGALALGPLCAQILADQGATFADTTEAEGGFLMTVRFAITQTARRTTSGAH